MRPLAILFAADNGATFAGTMQKEQ